MKKTLFALAAASVFPGAVYAQSNVAIYGITDIGINVSDNGAAANSRTVSLDGGIQTPSRIGFKGTEDLGGGLSASFQLENGFDLSTGQFSQAGRLFGRQAWVGLNGGFGSVKFGRQWAPLFLALDEIDPFGTGLSGDASRIFASGGYPVRMDNAINYSMSANGFSGQVTYGLGEVAGSQSANRQTGVGLGYANGPLNLQFGYHKANTTAAPAVTDARSVFTGGSYDFGIAKAHLAYSDNRTDSTVAGGNAKSRNWLLGVTAPVGSGSLMASYIRNDVRNAANADSSQFAIGYSHPLSKRTNLYASYGRVSNDSGAALGGAAGSGDDPTLFNVGIRHKF